MSILHATHTNKHYSSAVPHDLASAVIVLNAHCRLIETMHWSVTVYVGKASFRFLNTVHNKNGHRFEP